MATKCTDKDKIKYPVLGTPKLDGIRCLKLNSQALSRTFKPIPNPHIREMIETLPNGLDGEIMAGGGSAPRMIDFSADNLASAPETKFGELTGIVMSKNAGVSDFRYYVFDYIPNGDINAPYWLRMKWLAELSLPGFIVKVLPVEIHNRAELDAFEQKCIDEGYEGAMIRTPNSPYKCGRSTEKEGWLLKIKRFEDGEAIIIGFDEKMHNANEAVENAVGHTERSTRKDGMVPTGTLGTLLVRDLKTKIEFGIGSGLDDETRKRIWDNRDKYLGKIVKYKYQPYGIKEAPRFPVFLGFRDPDDM